MIERRLLKRGSLVWAGVGLLVALAALGSVNRDARPLYLAATAVGVGSALVASRMVKRHEDRLAGLLLIVSVITPTTFAWIIALPALLVGIGLLIAPRRLIRSMSTT